MLKSSNRALFAGLLTVLSLGGRLDATLDVDTPDSTDQFANNVNIDADGTKPLSNAVTAYLKREIAGVFTIVTNGQVDVTPTATWSATFTPNPNWTNGNYKGHVKQNVGGATAG